jgi:hypothetical protein
MAIKGRKPKPPGEAVNRNQKAFADAWVEVENVPNNDSPHRLPRKRPNGDEWLEATVQKWRAWRTMPHTRLWSEADWQFCLDTVEICARFHAGNNAAAAELRAREAIMGTTVSARLGLRIRYVEPKAEKPKLTVVNGNDFRDL